MSATAPVARIHEDDRPVGPGPVSERRTFDVLYQEHFPFVWRSLRRLGVPDATAEDAAQDAFLVVHRRLGDLRPDASAKAWLFGIALRVARDYRRSGRRKGTLPLEDPDARASNVAGPHENAAKAQAARFLEAFLEALDEDRRAVFVMAELEQLSSPEIAEALGVKLNTVYSRLRVARELFAKFITERKEASG